MFELGLGMVDLIPSFLLQAPNNKAQQSTQQVLASQVEFQFHKVLFEVVINKKIVDKEEKVPAYISSSALTI